MAERQKHLNRYFLVAALLVCAASQGCGDGFARSGVSSARWKGSEGGTVPLCGSSGPFLFGYRCDDRTKSNGVTSGVLLDNTGNGLMAFAHPLRRHVVPRDPGA